MSLDKLPLRLLGLKDIPAIPVSISEIPETALRLGIRVAEMRQATTGLSNVYTIDGITAPAYPFLFGESDSDSDSSSNSDSSTGGIGKLLAKGLKDVVKDVKDVVEDVVDLFDGDDSEETSAEAPNRADFSAADRACLLRMSKKLDDVGMKKFFEDKVANRQSQPLTPARKEAATEAQQVAMTGLSLDDPKQFSMSWTNFSEIYQQSLPDLDKWAATLTDVDEANRLFWPTIAEYGLVFNLLFLKKLGAGDLAEVMSKFGDTWSDNFNDLQQQGLLYLIDLSIFESLEHQEADGSERLTPATLTLLAQNPLTKELRPVAVRVSRHEGADAQCYVFGRATDGAWLYALQAAKTSVAVYGIWLGHVYHWHIVTGAMQMTMFNTLSEGSALYQLLAPQSKYMIGFDEVLLLLWETIGPPTSITSGWQFLELCNTFAKGRTFFDDDPIPTLERLGLEEKDFTVDEPWDRYPVVRQLLHLWRLVEKYIRVFVEVNFTTDEEVAKNQELQDWIEASAARSEGNIRGLPTMDNRAALIRVLTSLIFRVTAHGNDRLLRSISSAQLFVANYPPCLQKIIIPDPATEISPKELLAFLPKTGTIGKMVTFYFIFIWSAPYEPFVPLDGVKSHLFFDGGLSNPCNEALVALREGLIEFMKVYEEGKPQVTQWPLNVET